MNKYEAHHTFEQITKDTDQIQSKCNTIMFENKGATNAILNDVYTFNVGDNPLILGGEKEVTDKTVYKIRFIPVGATQLILITRKYINEIKK